MTFVYVDCETTGLNPRVHFAYEYAWAIEGGPIRVLHPPHTLNGAEPIALKVGGYFDRGFGPHERYHTELWVTAFKDLRDATLVGANTGFDANFMEFRIFGSAPWKYRKVDVESMAYGLLGHDEPKGLKAIVDELRDGFRFNIPEPGHTAESDVATTRAVHLALLELRRERIERMA